jgi:hypothetical protein
MLKTYYHNNKSISENKGQKKTIPFKYIDQKRIVDINKLLNRVRMDEKNETKKKIIFCSSIILALGLFSTLIIIIN